MSLYGSDSGRIPAAIGPYQIVAELGRGGMGVVYEARHPSLPERRLALKQMQGLGGEESLLRFQREAQLMARIEHPNVLKIYDCAIHPAIFLVTDLVEGQDFKEVRREREFAPAEAAALVAQVADAVGALHEVGIVHRDLKPDNVILRPDGTPVLLDFGLARDLDAETMTQTGAVLGTPAYMSPEQADGTGKVGPPTDVYGLGGILYFLLCGEAPHGPGSLANVLYSVLNNDPNWSRLRGVPSGLLAILKRSLAREPSQRYADASELAAALRAPLAGKGASRAPLAIGALLALLGLAAAGAWVARRPSSGSSAGSPTPSATARPSRSPSQLAVNLEEQREAWKKIEKSHDDDRALQALRLLETAHPELRPEILELLREEPLWSVRPFRVPDQPKLDATYRRGLLELDGERVLAWNAEMSRSEKGLKILSRAKGAELETLSREPVSAVHVRGAELVFAAGLPKVFSLDLSSPAAKPTRIEVVGAGASYSNPVLSLTCDDAGIYALCGKPEGVAEVGGLWMIDRQSKDARRLTEEPAQGRKVLFHQGELLLGGCNPTENPASVVHGVRSGSGWEFRQLANLHCEDLVVSPDGFAVVGFLNGNVMIKRRAEEGWVEQSKLVMDVPDSTITTGHEGQLNGLAVTPSGELILSAGTKTTTKGAHELVLWRRTQPGHYQELTRIKQRHEPRQLSVSGDGTRLYVVYANRRYAAWYLPALAAR